MKLSPWVWVFALIISCSLSYGQYGKDFEDMSRSEKILMYNSYNKSPALGVFCEFLFPTLGYIYIGEGKRGVIINSIQYLGSPLIGLTFEKLTRGIIISNEDPYDHMMAVIVGGSTFVLFQIYEYFDVAKQTRNYNKNLYREIFGKEPPSFSLNLQPTYQGANLTLAYKFD
ncbi:MAG: hypothetical protein HOA66_01560 [Candidatus Marinimicrobia bacterium]|nr:hypothetical protein [Candidatus Neomarinimicrobiota bacterium]